MKVARTKKTMTSIGLLQKKSEKILLKSYGNPGVGGHQMPMETPGEGA